MWTSSFFNTSEVCSASSLVGDNIIHPVPEHKINKQTGYLGFLYDMIYKVIGNTGWCSQLYDNTHILLKDV